MQKKYLFTSDRLGFRNWLPTDKPLYASLNADSDVMQFFPRTYNAEESHDGVELYKSHIEKYGFGYFAVDLLADNFFIGFIGMMHQSYESPFTPFIDIGWRLAKKYWNVGYATEGAAASLEFAFQKLQLTEIFCTTPWNNIASQKVALKIGMKKVGEFEHVKLGPDSSLNPMLVYKISNSKLPDQFAT